MEMLIDMSQVLESFRQALEQAGIITDEIIADGEIHRCGTVGKENRKDGAYLFHNDPPHPAGWYKNYRTGEESTWRHKGQISSALSYEEREHMRRKIDRENAKRQAKREAAQAEIAKKAQQILASLPIATEDMPYLKSKGVKLAGRLYADEATLVVPVLSSKGQPQSLQHIYPDGAKRFLKGGKTQGGYFPIEGNDGPLFIVEGLATGLSVHEATGNTVLCAFNAGNLKQVARIVRDKYPDREIVIAGDNDRNTNNNPGLTKALEAAKEVGALVVIPSFPDDTSGSDFNDVHSSYGIEEVREQLKNTEAVRSDPANSMEAPPPLDSMRPPEDFPRGIFPASIENSLIAAAKAFAVSLAVPCLAFLVATAAAIGRTRTLVAKPGWDVYPNFFAALVANSGMGKTPCTSRIFNALQEQDYRYYQEFQEAKSEYDESLQAWKNAQKKSKSSDQEKPIEPTQTELLIDDATMEKIAHILAANPRGILWYRDELSGLIKDLGRYNPKGHGDGDKARLLSSYSVKPWKSSRATKDGVYVRAACITLFGTIQPQIVSGCFEEEDRYSGLLQRFIFINVQKDGPALWVDAVYTDKEAAPVDNALEFLTGLKLNQDETPSAITMSAEGQDVVIKKFNMMAYEVANNPELELYESLLPKQQEQLFKFCLTLHMLYCWETGMPDSTPVAADTVRRAAKLIDWVAGHQRITWDMLAGKTKPFSGGSLGSRVGKTIVELEHKISKGVLSTADIAAHLNANLPPEFHVPANAVGKSYKKLGLETCRSAQSRGVSVSPEQLEALKQAYGSAKDAHEAPPPSTLNELAKEALPSAWDGNDEVVI